MRQEPVGGGVRILVADAQVIPDRLRAAELHDGGPGLVTAPVSTAANPSGHSATVATADSSMGPVTLSPLCIAPPILGWRATPGYLQTHGVGIGENRIVSGRRRDDPGREASNPGRRTPPNGSTNQHPGMANYPADDSDYRRARRPPPMPSANRYLPPIGHQPESDRSGTAPRVPPPANESPSPAPRRSEAAKWVRGCTGWCSAPPPPTAPTSPV